MVVKSKVGPDGVLQLNVPVGPADANREVQVTIEPASPTHTTQEEWREFIRTTAGAWQGGFERPPQGEYEKRDEL
jgi:hypothetical protein